MAKLNVIVQVLPRLTKEPQYANIVHWQHPELVITDKAAFIEQVLPSNFRHSKFESFIRQLNLYGFHKVLKKDPNVLSFKHPNFLPNNLYRLANFSEALATIQLRNKQPQKEENVKIEE